MDFDAKTLLLITQITGLTTLVKNMIPDNVKTATKWYFMAFLPVIMGGAWHFITPEVTLVQGITAGILTAIGYKGQTTVVNATYNKTQ